MPKESRYQKVWKLRIGSKRKVEKESRFLVQKHAKVGRESFQRKSIPKGIEGIQQQRRLNDGINGKDK